MNKKLMYALIAIPVLVGGYLILRSMRKKSAPEQTPPATPPTTPPQQGNIPTPPVTGSGYENYTITTKESNLNIRQQPSTSSAVIGSLAKGSKALMKPSATSGWMEYTDNGTTTVGYVSGSYVTKS